MIQKDIGPGFMHRECTYFTHPYIARDSETHELRLFSSNSITSVVFEGLNFDADTARLNNVSIFK